MKGASGFASRIFQSIEAGQLALLLIDRHCNGLA